MSEQDHAKSTSALLIACERDCSYHPGYLAMDAAPEQSSDSCQPNYTDYSRVQVHATLEDLRLINPTNFSSPSGGNVSNNGKRRGPSQSFVFPTRLYEILTRPELSHIIMWMEHGRSWKVVDKQAFTEQVMPKYFANMAQYTSFIRQVNGWGFRRITRGADQDFYYHELFLRTMKHLVKFITRHSAGPKRIELEPNLRAYPFLPPNPPLLHAENPTKKSSNGNGPIYGHSWHDFPTNHACLNHSQYKLTCARGPVACTLHSETSQHPYHSSSISGTYYEGNNLDYNHGQHQHPPSANNYSSPPSGHSQSNSYPSYLPGMRCSTTTSTATPATHAYYGNLADRKSVV